MLYYSVTCKRFHLFYCITGRPIVTVCHFVRSLMAFVCREIKGLLTYLLTCLLTYSSDVENIFGTTILCDKFIQFIHTNFYQNRLFYKKDYKTLRLGPTFYWAVLYTVVSLELRSDITKSTLSDSASVRGHLVVSIRSPLSIPRHALFKRHLTADHAMSSSPPIDPSRPHMTYIVLVGR